MTAGSAAPEAHTGIEESVLIRKGTAVDVVADATVDESIEVGR